MGTEKPEEVSRRRFPQTFGLLGVIAGCLLYFCLMTPRSAPSIMLFVGFVVLGLLIRSVLRLVCIVTGLDSRMSTTYRRGILTGGTIVIVLLLMLQSIGQLTIRDVLTLGGLFVLGMFYVGRTGKSRT